MRRTFVQISRSSGRTALRGRLRPLLAVRGRRDGHDIVLANSAADVLGLAALTRAYPTEQVCIHLFVEHSDECLIEACDRDFDLDSLLLTEAMGPSLRTQFEAALTLSAPSGG